MSQRNGRLPTLAGLMILLCAGSSAAVADNLYLPGQSHSLTADHRAALVGDTVTVVIVQTAEATTTVRTGTRRKTEIGGGITNGSFAESADFSLGGSFDGQGQASRSERFITQLTAQVTAVRANGDLEIVGVQRLKINGETTTVEVKGIVRPIDIDADNRVPSNRIAAAQINYQGNGFVSRSVRPGLVQRLFRFFGLL